MPKASALHPYSHLALAAAIALAIPAVGSKSFFISHCAMSGFSVSARHSFFGGCGNTLSITTVRVLSAGLLIIPSFPKVLQDGQTGRARRRRRERASPPSALAAQMAIGSNSIGDIHASLPG